MISVKRAGFMIGWMLTLILLITEGGRAVDPVHRISVDGNTIAYCGTDVDVEKILGQAVISLSQGASDAEVLSYISSVEDTLYIGDLTDEEDLMKILTEEVPIKVRYTREKTEFMEVPFTTSFIGDDGMFTDEMVVETAGMKGEGLSVWTETCVNDEVIGEEFSRTVITQEPIERVVRIGTVDRPIWWPTGVLRQPLTGKRSSPYGWRWGKIHTGLDISCSVGTKVCAADSGKVVFAGWLAGYGYYIQIDHTNGYMTCYAHNSKLLVSAGDAVVQGQQIALSGMTGNVTGPHLHFEVKVNGEFVNPENYIAFKFA